MLRITWAAIFCCEKVRFADERLKVPKINLMSVKITDVTFFPIKQ